MNHNIYTHTPPKSSSTHLPNQNMADIFRGHERRYSDFGGCSHPSTESLIVGKLDELDIRLTQLEEKQSLPESYFAADLRRAAVGKSLTSALKDVRLKGTLMDRVHLLESRIRQLSSDLDQGNGGPSSSSTMSQMNENGPEKNKKKMNTLSSSRVVGAPWRELKGHKSKSKDSKEGIEAMEKRASAVCRNEKKRKKRARIYKRWFPVGC